MSLSRKNLAIVTVPGPGNYSVVDNYTIDLINEDAYTYSIQISDLINKKIVADLPLDAPDNTLAATLDPNTFSELGKDAAIILEALSKALEQIGGKEFVVKPACCHIPDYIPVEDHAFKRVRQGNREDLVQNTSTILDERPDLVAVLDEKLEFVNSITELSKKIVQPYRKILDLLEGHAHFTDGKMTEYKDEDIQGVKARFHHKHINSVAVLDKEKNLVGIMRCLAMGNKFGYLSDETFNQDILPLAEFKGDTTLQQMKNRARFLLAYFAHKVLSQIQNQDQFIIIAAAGREDIYDAIGFQQFPIKSNNYVVTMKFAKPGPELDAVKERLMNPFSHAEALVKLGLTSAPITGPSAKPIQEEVKQQQTEISRKFGSI